MKTATERLHEAFDKFKDKFVGSFHTTLWAVLHDNVTDGKLACFVSNYVSTGMVLGIAYANEQGYQPTPCHFKSGKYDDALEVLKQLNKIVFELEEEAAFRIVISSMRAKVKSNDSEVEYL